MSNQRDILSIIPPEEAGSHGVMPGFGTRIHNQSGERIDGITKVNIEIVPDDAIRAYFDAFVNLNSEFKVQPFINKMWAQDPTDGDVKYIKRIEFADGNTLQENE